MTCETYICTLCYHTRNTWQYPSELPWVRAGDRPPSLPQQYLCTWCEMRVHSLKFAPRKGKWQALSLDELSLITQVDCDCIWKDSWKKLDVYEFSDGRKVCVSQQGRPDGIDGCSKCWGTGIVLEGSDPRCDDSSGLELEQPFHLHERVGWDDHIEQAD